MFINGLALNTTKTEAICFGTLGRLKNLNHCTSDQLTDSLIHLSDHIKLLGVTLDSNPTITLTAIFPTFVLLLISALKLFAPSALALLPPIKWIAFSMCGYRLDTRLVDGFQLPSAAGPVALFVNALNVI